MATPTSVQTTPLHAHHVALGARMMPFAGFDMPVQYSGIVDEHMAVRNAAGVFDVSHMGEVYVEGPHAFDFVQQLVTNDASTLTDGRAMYAAMCTESGGIVDDLLVYRFSEERYMLVINASNIEGDLAWMHAHNPMGANLTDRSSETALIAVQGPKAMEIVGRLTDMAVEEIPYYHFAVPAPGTFLECQDAILSHTGYTGEPGLEIYCEAGRAAHVWERLLEAGADLGLKPAGLGARDTLRLEAGYCLYGNDITLETTPLEAGLGWITKLKAGPFVGSDALAQQKADGIPRRLVAFVMQERGIPRQGYPLFDAEGQEIGVVTSGSQSPILGAGIGLGYVPRDARYTKPGSELFVGVRSRRLKALVGKTPLHK
ncbi:MAG: glycine cleavage system aminomethyltransferase GcvT [Bacteroidota bacterium]